MNRLALVIALSALAVSAKAQTADTRNGAPMIPLRGQAQPASSQGLLSWAGKPADLRGRAQAAAATPASPVGNPRIIPWPKAIESAPQRSAARATPTPTLQPIRQPVAPTAPVVAKPMTFAPPPVASAGGTGPLTPRRYSVGREFGVEPDPIAMPGPSILAFGPDVGAAYAAQNARADVGDEALSPADVDLLEQANQDDARRETRQKARDKAAAAKN